MPEAANRCATSSGDFRAHNFATAGAPPSFHGLATDSAAAATRRKSRFAAVRPRRHPAAVRGLGGPDRIHTALGSVIWRTDGSGSAPDSVGHRGSEGGAASPGLWVTEGGGPPSSERTVAFGKPPKAAQEKPSVKTRRCQMKKWNVWVFVITAMLSATALRA